MKHKNLTLSELRKLALSLYKTSGKGSRIFGLIGPLGAGKTTFIKTMAEAMGIQNSKSPTFTIVNCYKAKERSLYHIDLYRLNTQEELDALGLEEILEDEKNLVAIEWVDKFKTLMKQCDKLITLEVANEDKRNVAVRDN